MNRKHLEIKVHLPQELLRFEADVRRWVGAAVQRGMVTVHVRVAYQQSCPLQIRPNLAMARQVKEAWDAIATDLKLASEQGFHLGMLSEVRGILCVEEDNGEDDAYKDALETVTKEALGELSQMKEAEGQALQREFLHYLGEVEAAVEIIRKEAPHFAERFRERLKAHIEELAPKLVDSEERLLRELAIYAEKVDIAEELDRTESHLQQFRSGIEGQGPGGGKRLDFLAQELYREANTMGAKASGAKTVSTVVEIKTALERIREQLQNVE